MVFQIFRGQVSNFKMRFFAKIWWSRDFFKMFFWLIFDKEYDGVVGIFLPNNFRIHRNKVWNEPLRWNEHMRSVRTWFVDPFTESALFKCYFKAILNKIIIYWTAQEHSRDFSLFIWGKIFYKKTFEWWCDK